MKNQLVLEPLVPEHLLQNSEKILFITHLAIGDYTYMQNYFKAFAEKYPHLKIDLWVDEVRRTRCFWRWPQLKKYSLYDWINRSSFFRKIYDQTYSPKMLKRSIKLAQQQDYALVVYFCLLRKYNYAKLARTISSKGFIVGVDRPIKQRQFLKRRWFNKLDAKISFDAAVDCAGRHISDVFADWFEKLFDMRVERKSRAPFVIIPREWISYAKLRFLKWKIEKRNNDFGLTFFINAFAKHRKRCWAITHVVALIKHIKKTEHLQKSSFIVNAPPQEYSELRDFVKKQNLSRVFVFTAGENFFQLPAVMSCCDVVVSVETSTIHLASALQIPVIALMRQKNPEWVPWNEKGRTILMPEKRSEWVKNIPVDMVFDAVKKSALLGRPN